ncbi:signal peptidase I [Brevibacillus dissolubilis]|uniref:signal peptidase I n=1 Tax=Brevibacillus dissolubilis TaxID=1844116 RepID=UPI0011179C1E|nr:signal peptidase I [Brevibacillus dissolubilis]
MSENVTSTPKKKSETWEWVQALAIAIALALAIRTFLFAPFIVEGESMEYTLHNTEKLVVNKAIYYMKDPQPGDIIVFHAEETRDYIKRVIAVAGDSVEIKDDKVYVNDKVVEEPFLAQKRKESEEAGYPRYLEDYPKTTIPEGHIFVMGDNRQNSRDSRAIGPVPVEKVVGRSEFVFWPLKDIRMID